MPKDIDLKRLQHFLKQEIDEVEEEEIKTRLQETLDYFIQKEQRQRQEWGNFTAFLYEEVEKLKKRIKALHLNVYVKEYNLQVGYFSLEINITHQENTQHEVGLLEVIKLPHNKFNLEGGTFEDVCKDVTSLKEHFVERITSEQVYEICVRLSHLYSSNKTN